MRWDSLGESHPVLAGQPDWQGPGQTTEIDARAREVLAAVGLYQGDRLDPRFRDALVVLTRPSVEFSCWATDAQGPYRILVAAIGSDAVALSRAGDLVRLQPARPDALAEDLVAMLPDTQPAKAHALNVPRSTFDNLLNPAPGGTTGRRADEHAAKQLRAALELPRTHTAELHAATRDRSGARNPAGRATVLDTAKGRWLIRSKQNGAKGDDWIVATPATPRLLIDTLYELRTSAR
ncbi:ESX secretion-associated protein EspG [Tamaricihabitans halophyticus]|nr:ESX secretion-associated protein EspG [Tamaricihabitans halophyticus]